MTANGKTTRLHPAFLSGTGAVSILARVLNSWRQRAQSRKYLARLDERMLRDIGLDQQTAAYEISRRFWQK